MATIRKLWLLCCVALSLHMPCRADKLFIPMDNKGQTDHLKAYGIVYHALQQGIPTDWLLNYKGGSYGLEYSPQLASLCRQRNVAAQRISNAAYSDILRAVNRKDANMNVVQLKKPPRIAVYTPPSKEPWDDAVTLALTYAGIPFDKVYAGEVLHGALEHYDWLHLHHEDFTGQYGKFWAVFKDAAWYKRDKAQAQETAQRNGYPKVWQMQQAVVRRISDFVNNGGNLFAMCTATDTYDIALAAEGVDICDTMFDGDKPDNHIQQKLNYSATFAFRDFILFTDPLHFEFSSIDNTEYRAVPMIADSFDLIVPPARLDIVPAMLCQNHVTRIKGFMGMTTAFRKQVLKPDVLILASFDTMREARYIHGTHGRGSWTFYGGHDPEDYAHAVNDTPTNLAYHPHSPGYRLILNNVLCPAADLQEVPTVRNTEPAPAIQDEKRPIQLLPENNGDAITIRMTSKITSISISNTAGKVVISKNCNDNAVTVDLKQLPQGVYLVEVNGIFAGRFIREGSR